MSSLNRSIASVLGTFATLYLAYQAQARCEVNMSQNDTPTSVQRAVRLIMSFITVVIIGGLSDAIIKATFSSL
ncbi:hypothetical protein [Proteus sp. TJ1640]|uniref:hypothetical protein n=1 Tax=Proteus sp. TJ1640 TaxID=2050968 RepID=UPI000D6960A8|nr:hypothetical protein [Proteus sp. TJ1640]